MPYKVTKTGGGTFRVPPGIAKQVRENQIRRNVYERIGYFCRVWRVATSYEKKYLESCLTDGEISFIRAQVRERDKLKNGEKEIKAEIRSSTTEDSGHLTRLLTLVSALVTLLLHFFM